GSNLAAVAKHPKVDVARLNSNDVQEIARVLGIEAARNSLMNEIKQVLDLQNLNVDVRHCMLLADAMTMDGGINSIGRHGLSGEKAGVLARAAFEETVKHLINAAVKGEEDKLIGVTENIIIGQTVPVGTGLVKLRMKLQ
ncbi:MAG: DNA-directed RNA polymerase subunit A'', partial [Candidatus Micrarchaeota archaeon]|nr:DNA-directed RNA polymerase subunit A'' [Candidatus Micrarchaeota archaeon]